MGKLDGKVAIVTGGARGQGGAEATMFRAEGADVVITDVLRDEGTALAAGIGATFIAHDVRSEEEWAEVVRQTLDRHGRIDVLVNNAGIFVRAKLTDTDLELYRRVIDVNQVGVFLGMKAVVPAMIEAGGGSIVNISSISGFVGQDKIHMGYNASKGAVRIMTKSGAVQYGKDGIRVNSVHPGFLPPMRTSKGSADPAWRKPLLDAVPLRREGRIEEVAHAVLFLASDEASYISGTELVVDGGFLAV